MHKSVDDAPKLAPWRRAMIIAKMGLLWCGGVLFLIEAAGHQIQYSSSWAFVPLITTALALLPPSRAFLSRLLGWKASADSAHCASDWRHRRLNDGHG